MKLRGLWSYQAPPPSEPPLVLYLYGEDDKDLATANSVLQLGLGQLPSLSEIRDPLQRGIREDVFKVDHLGAARHGFSPGDVARLMQLAVTGREIGKMEADGELVPVYAIGKSEQLRRVVEFHGAGLIAGFGAVLFPAGITV